MLLFTSFLLLYCIYYMIQYRKTKTSAENAVCYIKYDKREQKVLVVSAIICTISWIICVIAMESREFMDGLQSPILITIVFAGCYFSPLVAIVCWIKYMECFLYFKRLRKYGYEIPDKKEKYSYDLKYLPRVKAYVCATEKVSVESVVLAGINAYIGMCTVASGVYYVLKYSFLDDMAWFIFGIICAMSFGWFITGIVFWRQRNRLKYRDDVESDCTRKVRKHMSEQIIPMLIGIAITVVVIVMLGQLAEVIYRSRIASGWYQ